MSHILLVEDDQDLSIITHANLTYAGHKVDDAFTCAQAEELLSQNEYDLILLDIMLPDRSGDDLCRSIRQDCDCPIIFMSCLEDSETIVDALRSGGDDYMVKPIEFDELKMRIKAILRRTGIAQSKRLVIGGTVLDREERSAYVDGVEVVLTPREFDIVFKLLSYPKKTFSRQALMDEFWDSETTSSTRTVDVYVTKLRDKFSFSKDFEIQTVHGLGYKAVLL